MKDQKIYLSDWKKFKEYCEDRAKQADCHINNKGWHKLREYHLSNFLKDLDNPYRFLFSTKYAHRKIFNEVRCMTKYYRKYLQEKKESLDSRVKDMVEFPNWRKK